MKNSVSKNHFKMERKENVVLRFKNIGGKGSLQRFIFFTFVILAINIDISTCYSNVRRGGSLVSIEELKKVTVKESPNITPMIKPVGFKYLTPQLGDTNSKKIENPPEPNKQSSADSLSKSEILLKEINKDASEKDGYEKNRNRIPTAAHKDGGFVMPEVVEGGWVATDPKNLENKNTEEDDIIEAIDLVAGDGFPGVKQPERFNKLESELLNYVDETFSKDNYDIFGGVKIEPVSSLLGVNVSYPGQGSPRSVRSTGSSDDAAEGFDTRVMRRFDSYARNHVLSVNLPQAARFFGFKYMPPQRKFQPVKKVFSRVLSKRISSSSSSSSPPSSKTTLTPTSALRTFASFVDQGKSTFLTGFGLGFLAFGLKKLLLPIFIGAQIVKSVLIAMFLPSILGSLGKIVGKGLSQFSGSSTNFVMPQGQQVDDLDYKDNQAYGTEQDGSYTYPNTDNIGTLPANSMYGTDELGNVAMSRYGPGGAKVTYLPNVSDNYYKHANRKQEDYKVFHNIPASSLLLSNYDPFYSPLLSRLDSVFQRIGLGASQGGGAAPERCRERLVCLMYAAPAKYAPYSNLVSAQLSRELNELRKPTSDNPEILRFFRYMKAAKDGQEGVDCARAFPSCPELTAESGSAAMITTYNDINKLVSARKIH